jgi:hypothetical protein
VVRGARRELVPAETWIERDMKKLKTVVNLLFSADGLCVVFALLAASRSNWLEGVFWLVFSLWLTGFKGRIRSEA